MFKHPLFLKIILIFTLPALGILYFSTVLVYDKIKFLEKGTYKINIYNNGDENEEYEFNITIISLEEFDEITAYHSIKKMIFVDF